MCPPVILKKLTIQRQGDLNNLFTRKRIPFENTVIYSLLHTSCCFRQELDLYTSVVFAPHMVKMWDIYGRLLCASI